MLSTARLRRPAAPPEAAGKRRDSLTVHVSVFRKRGEKGRRNKSTVERQLVNAESSRSEGLTERCAGSPPRPRGHIPALVGFPHCRGSQNLGEGHLCSQGEPGASRTCWCSRGNCLQAASTEPCPCPSLVPPLRPPCSAPAPAAQCLCLPGELLPDKELREEQDQSHPAMGPTIPHPPHLTAGRGCGETRGRREGQGPRGVPSPAVSSPGRWWLSSAAWEQTSP